MLPSPNTLYLALDVFFFVFVPAVSCSTGNPNDGEKACGLPARERAVPACAAPRGSSGGVAVAT